jgi:hypothetical protein
MILIGTKAFDLDVVTFADFKAQSYQIGDNLACQKYATVLDSKDLTPKTK